MDLLVEKLDGSRYYLSQYKVLITDLEESAPSVTRNSKQLDQRNGNIDFGGWHTDKTINITGYYRADDIDDEETLREKLYALLSDPGGYYITQLKASPESSVERPGETSGDYYDKLSNYPSHKRFLVYTEAPEMELVGNVGGTLLYKLTAEFKTLKLPYGETPAIDIDIDNTPYKDVPVNLYTDTRGFDNPSAWINWGHWNKTGEKFNGLTVMETTGDWYGLEQTIQAKKGEIYTFSAYARYKSGTGTSGIFYTTGNAADAGVNINAAGTPLSLNETWQRVTGTVVITGDGQINVRIERIPDNTNTLLIAGPKLEIGNTATPWSPNPADPEYYSNMSIPYAGSVPCNQLEQGFTVQFTATGSASSLSLKIDDTELTSSGTVAAGDVFMFSGFSYTQNGLSIVSKTNKAYFVLQPDKPNRITCNVPGTVKILGFQNLYA